MGQIPAFHRTYFFCFSDAVWASASGGFRILSDTLVLYRAFGSNDFAVDALQNMYLFVSSFIDKDLKTCLSVCSS